MKTILLVIIVVILAVAGVVLLRSPKNMEIKSLAFAQNGAIPSRCSCDGGNSSPNLQISGVPMEVKSLAIIMDDPDATRGVPFTHWMIWNIPPSTEEFLDGRFPPVAIQGKNDAGTVGYAGPCPPHGASHHYHIKLYALDSELALTGDATLDDLTSEISKHLVDQTELVGIYTRP